MSTHILSIKLKTMKYFGLPVLLFVTSINTFAFTSKEYQIKPTGWDAPLSISTTNVLIYKKTKVSAYMQIVDVKGGARIEFSSPKIVWDTKGIPTFTRYPLLTHWNNLSSPVSIVNGQFFDPNKSPATTLSFAVKSNGSILTLGQDKNSFDPKFPPQQLEITRGSGAFVQTWNEYRIKEVSKAQNIIVGLHPNDSTKGPSTSRGRTAFCTNGKWVFIGTYVAETQSNVVKDLQTWGCAKENVVIFDGGGSTQLKTNSFEISGDKRLLPQVVAVYDR